MGQTVPMNFKNYSLLFFLVFYTIQAEHKLSLSTGPAWLFFESVLSPATTGNSFVATSNDQSAWNLLPVISANLTLDTHKYFNIAVSAGGGFLRNGIVTLTDARGFTRQDGSFFSRDAIANATINSRNFIVDGQLKLPIEEPFNTKISLGYYDWFSFEKLAFLFEPTIFFQRNRYKALHAELSLSKEYKKSFISVAYEVMAGTLRIRRTDNTTEVIILRKVPKVITSCFKIELGYKFTENFSFIEKIIYDSRSNHKIGTTVTFNNKIKESVQKNVESVKEKQFVFLTCLEYSF